MESWKRLILNYFVDIYRKIFMFVLPTAYQYLHQGCLTHLIWWTEIYTRQHCTCGTQDVTNSLVTSQQFDFAQLISSLVARKHLMVRTWPYARMFDLTGSYDMHLEKILHHYLKWVASDPILFSGKILLFLYISQTENLVCVCVWTQWQRVTWGIQGVSK